ncbi:MAG: hypothetical protein R3F14_04850 [Polyangiaceae bacterium]
MPSTEDEDCDESECALWSAIFGDAALQRPLDMAIDPGGNVLLYTFQGDMQVDSTLLSSKGSNDLFLIKLTPTGTVAWARSFGDGAYQGTGSLAVDSNANILLGGSFEGTIDFGCGPKFIDNGRLERCLRREDLADR